MYLEQSLEEINRQLRDIKERLSSLEVPEEKEILDNQDVLQLLKISSRTLQSYRDNGILPFSKVGGKIYYQMVDVRDLVKKNLVTAKLSREL